MDADSTVPGGGPDEIRPISITEEMKTSYLDYAMSVIVSRALPDVRDGLKPVHRRILYACQEAGYVSGRPYRKSSRIVGDVMGKYHPHGDSAIYDALARMTQDWSMRVPLIDGQGNFGSMDPDAPAAMRYTEARLARVADELLTDFDKDTVDFVDNYDGSESEPSVLPARFPNLLVNGAGGIAVGMATNIPPHNLGEVVDAALAYIENPAVTAEELMQHVPAPDFPTGALVMGQGGLQSAYTTGRGSVIMRSRHRVEEKGDRKALILTQIPFQVGKAGLVEKIAEAVKDKRIEGVADMRDESNRDGVRIVMDLKRDATAEVVLNQVFRHTPAQTSFAFNMLAIRGGRPELLNLRDIIEAFIRFREEVITRRSKFELGKARDRAHILLGLVVAVTNVDEVVAMIRGASSPAEAREKLLAKHWPIEEIADYIALVEGDGVRGAAVDGETYRLSERQVKAILDLRLNRLTQLGREEIAGELKEISYTIEDLLDILSNRARMFEVMREELLQVRERYATDRKTELIPYLDDIDDEDLIEREDMVVTVTLSGYIKRVPLGVYRAQRRGGKGRSGLNMKDEDVVTQLFVASTHTPVLFFSSLGQVYRLKVWKLPEGSPQSRGRAMANLLPLEEGETISTVLPLPEDEEEWSDLNVVFATRNGSARRNSMDAFTNIPTRGKIAMRFEEGADDRLIGVALCTDEDDVFLASRQGKAIRFASTDIREFQSRTSTGVRAMKLAKGDEVMSLSVLRSFDVSPEERDAYFRGELNAERQEAYEESEEFILTVSANGFGKRTSSHHYRRTGRGGQGVTNLDVTDKTGPVVASFPVEEGAGLMLVTDLGKMIRTRTENVRVTSRATQGVTLFKVAKSESVVSAAKILEDDDEEEEGEDQVEGANTIEAPTDVVAQELPDGGDAEAEAEDPTDED
ncbi:DNA gyrase subunit A [Pacificimonas flava]|uniref:DNA gyrase subunit A n=2 Tax=Pacificimonas TaxID=1960290 RepID=A0A219B7M3_9SPHN|nr:MULTISPECIES: DNA gyrase subunit A [Pacificimonas]MBZ6378565.1 DNA gyrase subunit A [Pacificimonas aurantium]OWV34153.1 DNA gyrase subunit A [Pacificimonas flava]